MTEQRDIIVTVLKVINCLFILSFVYALSAQLLERGYADVVIFCFFLSIVIFATRGSYDDTADC